MIWFRLNIPSLYFRNIQEPPNIWKKLKGNFFFKLEIITIPDLNSVFKMFSPSFFKTYFNSLFKKQFKKKNQQLNHKNMLNNSTFSMMKIILVGKLKIYQKKPKTSTFLRKANKIKSQKIILKIQIKIMGWILWDQAKMVYSRSIRSHFHSLRFFQTCFLQ